jgi:hypothetical protein
LLGVDEDVKLDSNKQGKGGLIGGGIYEKKL